MFAKIPAIAVIALAIVARAAPNAEISAAPAADIAERQSQYLPYTFKYWLMNNVISR